METGEETTVALTDNIPYSRQLRVKRIYARSGLVHATLLGLHARPPVGTSQARLPRTNGLDPFVDSGSESKISHSTPTTQKTMLHT